MRTVRIRYSLPWLFIIATIFSFLFGFTSIEWHRQQRIAREIHELGGNVIFHDSSLSGAKQRDDWNWFPKTTVRVVLIDLEQQKDANTKRILILASQLPELQRVELRCPMEDDEQAKRTYEAMFNRTSSCPKRILIFQSELNAIRSKCKGCQIIANHLEI